MNEPLEAAGLTGMHFYDFPDGDIEEVAAYLYRNEPEFMSALETDIRGRGVLEPVELQDGTTVVDGHHRAAAAWRAGSAVPVTRQEPGGAGPSAEHQRWAELRRSHPAEHSARLNHDPDRWHWIDPCRDIEPDPEAGI